MDKKSRVRTIALLNKKMLSRISWLLSLSLLSLLAMPAPIKAVQDVNLDFSSVWAEKQEEQYFSAINETRQVNGLPALAFSGSLSAAARNKAKDMARVGYFAHYGSDGKTPWQWMADAGYEPVFAGENLARNGYDAAAVVSAWLASAGHRKNIMNDKYREMGIGLARGVYDGQETVFVVQMFGQSAVGAPLSAMSQAASS